MRAIKFSWHDAIDGDPSIEIPGLEFGVWQNVSLDHLIDRVFVAPTAPDWLLELVESVLFRYGLDKDVQRSKLDDEPLW